MAHQRESGILTGAGGSWLWSWSSDNRVFQLEPSRSPEPGILPEPAPTAGFGNRVSVPEPMFAGTRFFKSGTAVPILNLESGRTGEPPEPPKPSTHRDHPCGQL